MAKKKLESKEELAKRFVAAIRLSEENSFRAYLHKTLWRPEEFASLSAGLDPECYKQGKSIELSQKLYAVRAKHATSTLDRFLDDTENGVWKERDLIMMEDEIYVSSWKYIRWAAQRGIIISELFFALLPLTLMELYLEFRPTDSVLCTAPKRTRVFHENYYLERARELMKELGHDLTPTQLYNHSRMQGVMRYLRDLGGNYKKRTFLHSWLPKLQKRPRGGPRKIKKL